jgi:hypothetical protein
LQAGRNSNSEKTEVLADFHYISSADWAEQSSQKRLVLYPPLQKALWVEIAYSFLMNLKIYIQWHELICSEHLAARKKYGGITIGVESHAARLPSGRSEVKALQPSLQSWILIPPEREQEPEKRTLAYHRRNTLRYSQVISHVVL